MKCGKVEAYRIEGKALIPMFLTATTKGEAAAEVLLSASKHTSVTALPIDEILQALTLCSQRTVQGHWMPQ